MQKYFHNYLAVSIQFLHTRPRAVEILIMNISPWLIYLWGILDSAKEFAQVMSVILSVIAMIGGFAALGNLFDGDWGSETWAKFKVIAIRFAFMLVFFIVCSIFIPSSKTFAVMVLAPRIANSQIMQKDAPDLYRMAVEALENSLRRQTNQ